MKKCELCGGAHDGSYGSGRFCSQTCARSFSTNAKRDEINQKTSTALKGRPAKRRSEESIKKWKDTFRTNHWNKVRNNSVIAFNGDVLDITVEELQNYRKSHPVCEICGNPETRSTPRGPNSAKPNQLSIDHDHSTSHFRGLLCRNCNSRLGWLENNLDSIQSYLNKVIKQ